MPHENVPTPVIEPGDTGRGPRRDGQHGVAVVAIAFEFVALAWIRWRFFDTDSLRSFTSVTVGGAMIVATSARLGAVS